MFAVVGYMKFVEPIRDRKKIAQIKNLLRGQNRYRDLLLFVVGINTALRISDLLKLRINQFIGEDGKIKNRFWIKEQKRGKRHEITINQSMKEALVEYLEAYPFVLKDTGSYLFFNPKTKRPIKRAQALKLFRVKAAALTLRSCVLCSGSVGGFTFAHLSVRLPRNFTSKHLAQASFGGGMADTSVGQRG
ncbi:tyrosine-type recombinase/integrase [Chloroflexota bacterium]